MPFRLPLSEFEKLDGVKMNRLAQGSFKKTVMGGIEEQHASGTAIVDPVAMYTEDPEVRLAGIPGVVHTGIGGKRVNLVGDQSRCVKDNAMGPTRTIGGELIPWINGDADFGRHRLANQIGHCQIEYAFAVGAIFSQRGLNVRSNGGIKGTGGGVEAVVNGLSQRAPCALGGTIAGSGSGIRGAFGDEVFQQNAGFFAGESVAVGKPQSVARSVPRNFDVAGAHYLKRLLRVAAGPAGIVPHRVSGRVVRFEHSLQPDSSRRGAGLSG